MDGNIMRVAAESEISWERFASAARMSACMGANIYLLRDQAAYMERARARLRAEDAKRSQESACVL